MPRRTGHSASANDCTVGCAHNARTNTSPTHPPGSTTRTLNLLPLFAVLRATSEEALSELSADLGVEALPAFRFYREGKEVVEPVMGYKKKQLRAAVKDLMSKS